MKFKRALASDFDEAFYYIKNLLGVGEHPAHLRGADERMDARSGSRST